MKRRKMITVVSLVVVLVFAMSVNSMALLNWNSTSRCEPYLYVSGNTAYCSLAVEANDSSDSITAYVYLERVYSDGTSDMVTSWTGMTGTGTLYFSENYPVSSGNYQLRITVIVNGSGGMDVISDVV